MTDNPKSQSGSRLLGLPGEVRLLIYEKMFPPEALDIYAVRGNLHRTMQQQYTAGKYVAALATCRMIYNEGKREKLSELYLFSTILIKIAYPCRKTHPLCQQRVSYSHTG